MSKSDWQSVAMIGVIGLGAWYMLGKMMQGTVTAAGTAFCDTLPTWFRNLTGACPEDEPTRTFDPHGCEEGVTSWCSSLKHCVPLGLTCPTNLTPSPVIVPTTDPRECSLGMSWCEKQKHCVADYLTTQDYCDPEYVPPWQQPPDDPGHYPGLVDVCTWPNGDPLTVPPGMDCVEAVESMCNRFSSIPGYKGCP